VGVSQPIFSSNCFNGNAGVGGHARGSVRAKQVRSAYAQRRGRCARAPTSRPNTSKARPCSGGSHNGPALHRCRACIKGIVEVSNPTNAEPAASGAGDQRLRDHGFRASCHRRRRAPLGMGDLTGARIPLGAGVCRRRSDLPKVQREGRRRGRRCGLTILICALMPICIGEAEAQEIARILRAGKNQGHGQLEIIRGQAMAQRTTTRP